MKKYLKIYFVLVLNFQILYACLDPLEIFMLMAIPIILVVLGVWGTIWLYKGFKSWKR